MKINIEVDENLSSPIVTIKSNEINDEVNNIISYLNAFNQNAIVGHKDKEIYFLNPQDIETIYSEGVKIYANVNDNIYQLKGRLYEYEELLKDTNFIRISNSELINLHKVVKVNLSLNDTIEIFLKNGKSTYCSRRKISDLKRALGLKVRRD